MMTILKTTKRMTDTIIIENKKIFELKSKVVLSPAVYCGFGRCDSQRFTWWHYFLMDV